MLIFRKQHLPPMMQNKSFLIHQHFFFLMFDSIFGHVRMKDISFKALLKFQRCKYQLPKTFFHRIAFRAVFFTFSEITFFSFLGEYFMLKYRSLYFFLFYQTTCYFHILLLIVQNRIQYKI